MARRPKPNHPQVLPLFQQRGDCRDPRPALYRRHLDARAKFDQVPELTGPYWLLFDLEDREPEHYPVAGEQPKVVTRLASEMARAEQAFPVTATHPPLETYPGRVLPRP